MKDLIGKRFNTNNSGFLVVTGYKSPSCVYVEFEDTGYRTTKRLQAIKNGQVKDKLLPSVMGVGFVGDGIYPPSNNGKNTNAY